MNNIQLVFIICGFCICKFAFSLEFICNFKINTQGTFMVICRYMKSGKNFESLACTFPTEVQQGHSLPSFFISHFVNKYPFRVLFSAMFFRSLCFLSMICCFKWPQSIVLKCNLVFLSSRRL